MLAPLSKLDVRIKFMGDLPAVIGQRSLELELPAGNTVGDLFALLSERYGEAFTSRVFSRPAKLHHYMLVFVDGENIKDSGGLDAKLGNSQVDVVMLSMFVGG
jgi:molybdopterin converting factor small subunit